MAMGRRDREHQGGFWVPTAALLVPASHPFYEQVNRILDAQGFDGFTEGLCRKFYADKMGRPSLAPAIYFRLMLVGYLEGSRRVTRDHLAGHGTCSIVGPQATQFTR